MIFIIDILNFNYCSISYLNVVYDVLNLILFLLLLIIIIIIHSFVNLNLQYSFIEIRQFIEHLNNLSYHYDKLTTVITINFK